LLRLGKQAERSIRAVVFYPNGNLTSGICDFADMREKWRRQGTATVT
jgi:hypothetical protein